MLQHLMDEQAFLKQGKARLEQQAESLRTDVKCLKEQVDSVTSQLDRAKRERDRAERVLEEVCEETSQKERDLKRMKEKLVEVKNQVSTACEDRDRLTDEISTIKYSMVNEHKFNSCKDSVQKIHGNRLNMLQQQDCQILTLTPRTAHFRSMVLEHTTKL